MSQSNRTKLYQWCSLLLCLVGNMFSSSAIASQTVRIEVDRLNVRAAPNTQASVIGTVSVGQVYVSIASQSGWRRIWFDSRTGWVSSRYVSRTSKKSKKVKVGSLNVRSGPGTHYRTIGQTSNNAEWAIAETRGGWDKIYFGGSHRWIYGKFLNNPNPPRAPKSNAGFIQLPAKGKGFYSTKPANRSWGLPRLVYGLQKSSLAWHRDHPNWGKIGIGDLSLKQGGRMSGHVSHQRGEDVDIRLIRKDGAAKGTTIYQKHYSSKRNLEYIKTYLKKYFEVDLIFFNDNKVFSMLPSHNGKRYGDCRKKPGTTGVAYVMCWPNHHDHFHLRIK
ncbi:penicillin-insensitive murein endopeptidase [Spartinivicinus poritis]|uniref:Penicillin-insensitive murein endopeptidase n=1 Tax=Spartinivicinus poritis TaxID=2994640 RepID=A0ABT5U4K2_9GAMM|nr:penicillin-insensitive murein endopeptidase [Spartinivicinus sp. A2-2]MDE1461284.1 penicillin-insensitive murein endopeptidase [Spartinivicinus sp. A2-2]